MTEQVIGGDEIPTVAALLDDRAADGVSVGVVS